jgi:predicted PurR-regulated permease PerM
LLRGQTAQGLGLLAIYGAAVLTRTVLEPKILGKNLGLDPLLTLIAMYAGFRFWGVGGLLLTPILAAAVKSAFFSKKTEEI